MSINATPNHTFFAMKFFNKVVFPTLPFPTNINLHTPSQRHISKHPSSTTHFIVSSLSVPLSSAFRRYARMAESPSFKISGGILLPLPLKGFRAQRSFRNAFIDPMMAGNSPIWLLSTSRSVSSSNNAILSGKVVS